MNKKRVDPWDWPEEGVRVIVPPQASKVNPYIREKEYQSPPEETGNFHLIRPLVNFEIVDAATQKPIGFFHPPMEIVACFTTDDLIASQERGKPLKLGAWISERWWTIPTKHPPGECPHGNPEHVGAYTALITGKWDDPETGWGT